MTFKLERILKKHAHFDENLGYWVANGDTYTVTDPDTGETNEFPYGFSYCDDVPFEDQNKVVTDWTAENLTQTVSSQVPRFDANGEEWVYRWNESYVVQLLCPRHRSCNRSEPYDGRVYGNVFHYRCVW